MTRQTLKLFWQATWKYKKLLILSEIGATLFVLSSDIVSPLIVSQVIDRLTQAGSTDLQFSDFHNLLLLFGIMQIIYIVSGRLMMWTYIRLEPNVVRDLENTSFDKLQQHSLGFYADNFSGALVAKVNRLTAAYQRFIETTLGDFGMLARRYLAAIIVILVISPVIGIVFLVWTLLFCYSVVYLHRKKMVHAKAASAAQTRVTARLADIIANTLTIRSFARTNEEAKHFTALSGERRDLRFRSYLISDYIRVYKSFNIILLNFAVLSLSVYYGLQGSLSIGSIVLIQFYLSQLITQLWNFGRFIDRVEESMADAAEMTEVILLPAEVTDVAQPNPCHIKNGAIEFKDVTFQYQDASHQTALFNSLNITIKPGQKVGLVGTSGGGKSTLTKLLLRFMDIQAGVILIDGQNIANLRQEDVRRAIAYVPQEPLLFHRTIYENIAYGNPAADNRAVVRAAKQAYADEFIDLLPHGYETIVGERGVKLSGGQRQRVALARSILKDAPILILDEATSSLDSVSERYINDAIDVLMAGRTTIVVAHRLSTIRKLDRILVMHDGEIVEDGTHVELIKNKELYAELWAHQSGDFIGE